ncbi:hypothetical protein ACS0TY_023003 [Phlomoides rotata]
MKIHYKGLKIKKIILFSIMILLCTTNNTVHTQPDSYILSCGSTADSSTDSDGREWISDAQFLTSNHSLSSTAKSQDPSLPSRVPYMTARIFKSESTYKFHVSSTHRHWLRLHFYPMTYENLDPKTSFFAVAAAGVTLLSNFSASITAQALTQAYIMREFTITRQEKGLLDLTFTPTHTSFAFINGIEVISMPEIFHSASMVGSADPTIDAESCTMQTMFRMNVGGQYIAATADNSGLTRTWYDDSPYIYGAGFGVTSSADRGVKLAYPSTESRYIAPAEVYATARTMGPNATLNQNYNLTWIFEIDVSFTYLVRLHFCEYQFDKVNQRVFSIFINNQTAEIEADVIAWTGGKGVPIHKDYATYVSSKSGDNQLWLALHPNVDVKPEYYDSILNGVEIFKLNDTRGNLAGPNPVPSSDSESKQTTPSTSSKSSKKGVIIGSILGAAAALGLLLGLIAFLKRKARREEDHSSSSTGSWLPIYRSWRSSATSRKSGTSSSQISSSISRGLCRHFTLPEINLATNDFNESRVIGVGGFGKVYKGYIDGNSTTVAVKRANPSSEQGVHEFLNEIELLSKLRHRHLVSLIGACEENNEMILVYDYMANGTLRQHLYDIGNNTPLSWKQRLEICIGSARGIHYLHTGAKHSIIHRDVKSTNILLDDKWVAKVSDFGLSKTRHAVNQTHVSTVVKGSFGYLDPEYFKRQQLTDKSDVYSFGVVLFEALCGRPALIPSLSKEQVSLADWVILNHRNGTLEKILDPYIEGEINEECLKHYVETAVRCLSDHSLDRPTMGEVLWNLEYCLQLQSNPGGPATEAQKKADDAYATQTMLNSIAEDSEETDELNQFSSNSVFSYIMSPKGR